MAAQSDSRRLQQERFYRQVGSAIRAIRNSKKFTQEGVAAEVGLSRTSLTNIERGRQKLLTHTLVDIAKALGVSPTQLLPLQTNSLEQLSASLPSDLPAKDREFIERALIPGEPNEKDSRKSTAIVDRVRDNQRPGKR